VAVSTVQSGQSGVYAGIAGGHRALMLRRHGREGLPSMSSIIPGQEAHARQEPGSEHLCGVSCDGLGGKVSKNLRTGSHADTDWWHGLFDTQTSPTAEIFSLSTKRADTVGHSLSTRYGCCYCVGF